MINIAAGIYPNGLEKGKNFTNANGRAADPELKARAMAMLAKNISIKITAKKLNIPIGTLAQWVESEDRY